MLMRLSKIALIATTALFLGIVVLNNTTDYWSNYYFVEGVLKMETTFEGNTAMWRAIDSPFIYNIFYATIILWEAISCGLLVWGCWKMWSARKATAVVFKKAKTLAATGLVVSMLQWYLAFLTVGGEWFLMWQSDRWNGQDAATRMFLILGVILLFLQFEDGDPEAA